MRCAAILPVLLALAGNLRAGVAAQAPHQPTDLNNGMQLIATVESFGMQRDNVLHLLNRAGVTCSMDGSRAYGVFVPNAEVAKATKLLIDDAKRHPYDYLEIDGYKGKLGVPKATTWPYRMFGIALAKAAASPEFAKDPNLKGLALEAKRYAHKIYASLDAHSFKIEGIRFFKMAYLDGAGKEAPGYKAEITLSLGQTKTLYVLYSWSWEGGRRHETNSSMGMSEEDWSARNGGIPVRHVRSPSRP
jgi:hypothetical protein